MLYRVLRRCHPRSARTLLEYIDDNFVYVHAPTRQVVIIGKFRLEMNNREAKLITARNDWGVPKVVIVCDYQGNMLSYLKEKTHHASYWRGEPRHSYDAGAGYWPREDEPRSCAVVYPPKKDKDKSHRPVVVDVTKEERKSSSRMNEKRLLERINEINEEVLRNNLFEDEELILWREYLVKETGISPKDAEGLSKEEIRDACVFHGIPFEAESKEGAGTSEGL